MSRTFRAASRITESTVGTARIEITRAGIEITTVSHETSVVKDEVSTADRRVRMWLVTAMNYVVPSKVLNVEKPGETEREKQSRSLANGSSLGKRVGQLIPRMTRVTVDMAEGGNMATSKRAVAKGLQEHQRTFSKDNVGLEGLGMLECTHRNEAVGVEVDWDGDTVGCNKSESYKETKQFSRGARRARVEREAKGVHAPIEATDKEGIVMLINANDNESKGRPEIGPVGGRKGTIGEDEKLDGISKRTNWDPSQGSRCMGMEVYHRYRF